MKKHSLLFKNQKNHRVFSLFIAVTIISALVCSWMGNEEPVVEAAQGPTNSASIASLGFINYSLEMVKKVLQEYQSNSLYFQLTGHHLNGPFLAYWRSHDGLNSLGLPITESLNDKGKKVQYFEKARLEYLEIGADIPLVVPGNIGREILTNVPKLKAEPALTPIEAEYVPAGFRYFKDTKHTTVGSWTSLWEKSGGIERFGSPLTEQFDRTIDSLDYTVQIFEKGEMYRQEGSNTVVMAPSGYTLVGLLNIPTSPVPFDGKGAIFTMPTFSGAPQSISPFTMNVYTPPTPVPTTAPPTTVATVKPLNTTPPATTAAPVLKTAQPTPTKVAAAPAEHWVDVNLSTQTARFYNGTSLVRTNLITSGKKGFETPVGTFRINKRVYNETMTNGKPGDKEYYDLKNVLYTQYFTYEGHALHYAWWRSGFGVIGSHGCVNEDLSTAKFAWEFLTIGDRVVTHY